MFNPFETEFIYNLIILVYSNDPIGWIRVVVISILQIILIYHNDKWQYRLIIKIDILNYSNLFPIARLYSFSFLISIVRCYNKGRCNLAYEKVYLVEVLDIGLYNTIFDNYILKKSKPSSNNL